MDNAFIKIIINNVDDKKVISQLIMKALNNYYNFGEYRAFRAQSRNQNRGDIIVIVFSYGISTLGVMEIFIIFLILISPSCPQSVT